MNIERGKGLVIDCISDLHGYLPELPGGDLLIIAGDLTEDDSYQSWVLFANWLEGADYKKKVYIAGNHDNMLQNSDIADDVLYYCDAEYLCDSGTEFEGLKIWGSPWTKRFSGMNQNCMAFTVDSEEELAEKWSLIPDDIDILVTHSPANGVLDEIKDYCSGKILNVGSSSLIKPMINSGCRLFVFGHNHESYGKFYNAINKITYVNASHVNECFDPVNEPIRIEL